MYIHHLIHIDSVFREAKCSVCNEVMVIAKDMTNCPGCLKQFQQINRNMKTLYENTRLDLGWGLPIVSMPASNMSSPDV